jgi:hypothetical protein
MAFRLSQIEYTTAIEKKKGTQIKEGDLQAYRACKSPGPSSPNFVDEN